MEEVWSAFNISTGKSTGKGTLGRPRGRRESNSSMEIKEIGIKSRNCVDSAQKRDFWRARVNATLNLRAP